MKTTHIIIATLIGALTLLSVASGQYYGQQRTETITIQPKYMDLTPNDGLMDAGSAANPVIIKSDNPSAPTYEVAPKYHDVTPGDGIMDAGTYSNPNQIKVRY